MAEETTEAPAPPPEPEFLDGELALSRIQALVGNARTVWLGLIGFLAFIGLTLFSVRDVDFFSVSATTQLPIVNISIPTTTFFWTAALLAALLHTYFHVFLLKLWDALAEAPPEIGKSKLGDRTFPWLVNDWALRRRADRPITKRPMDLLGNLVTALVIWLAAPIVLAGFWWRSLPAHDARLSLTIAGALLLALFASLRGWRRARTRLARPGLLQPVPERRRLRPLAWIGSFGRSVGVGFLWVAMLAAVPVLAIATLAGAGGHHLPAIIEDTLQAHWPESFSSVPIMRANLVDAQIAVEPDDWRDPEIARRRFHVDWCRDSGVSPVACEAPASGETNVARADFCQEHGVAFADCAQHFMAIDDAFEAEWATERQAHLSNIRGPDLRGRDLRKADASGAFFAGVDLREAQLEGANLSQARLEGANLSQAGLEEANLRQAQLEGADLFQARLEGANLSQARLEGANLSQARLEGANFSQARLEGADLREARLEGADLREARLEGANLRRAGLAGADLFGARLDGADLYQAGLEEADLRGARLEGANLREAGLEGANLREARLEGADLGEAQLAGADLGEARLAGADLFGARLDGANLREAGLEGANLREARLEGANLREARLAGADLFGARLEGANLREAQLAGADLGEARLEGAFLHSARLDGANLYQARLEGADLTLAGLEGANLTRARLEGTNLTLARLEGAALSAARLEGANLTQAGLEGANLTRAGLEGADLTLAQLEGANLTRARLEGANLTRARLVGANLTQAGLEGANLHETRFQSAEWTGATFAVSPAHSADFSAGKSLTQTQLAQVIGDDDTVLPLDAETGAQLYVWSCWAEAPRNLEELLKIVKVPWSSADYFRAEWLCAEGEAPRKVGTPAEEVVEDSE